MDGPFPQLTDAELQKRRAEIQRSLNRINTAAGVIVVIVIGLAVAAIFAAYRAGKSAREARAATTRAEEQLWRSYLARAQAGRLSGVPGSRQADLDALKAAARIRRDPVQRNEYVAHLALLDYEPERPQVENPPNTTTVAFDSALERLAAVSRDGWVQLRRISDDGEVAGWRGSTMDRPTWRSARTGGCSPCCSMIVSYAFSSYRITTWFLNCQGCCFSILTNKDRGSRCKRTIKRFRSRRTGAHH